MDLEVIKDIIDDELNRANKIFPLFQTSHEAYGVMREELEEFNDEFKEIKQLILVDYWDLCKNEKKYNNVKSARDSLLTRLDYLILNGFEELIQLAAMVKKSKMLNEERKCKIE